MIFAGGKQLGTAIEIEVTKPVAASHLTRLWNNDAFHNTKNKEASFIHPWSNYFSIALFSIAIISGIYWQATNPANTSKAITSILIVACPCSLLLSATFTFGNLMRIFGKRGFFLKNANVIERIAEADVVVFDKTGTLTASGSNAHRGTGDYFVAEADESDGSFMEYHPFSAIITNVEHDHVDFFATEDSVMSIFKDFAQSINADGYLVYCKDDIGASKIAACKSSATKVSYGVDQSSDLAIDQITLLPMGSRSRVLWKGRAVGSLELQVPGHHNLLNAAAVMAMGLSLGLPGTQLLEGLASFQGAGRRFELKSSIAGIRIVDDYGHHPTEINVTLTAARRYAGDGRVLVVFQPHRYSRTKAFLHQFAAALDLADVAILLEIYPASEKPILGVSSSLIVDEMKNGKFIPNFLEASEEIIAIAQPGDVILTLGAGDVNSLAPIIAQGLERRFFVE